jgi:acetyl-CoA acyltransferase
MSIKAGVHDVVLAVGVEQMGKGLLGGAGGGTGIAKEGLLGSGTMPAVFAEAGMEHARKYGTTFEQFARVSVKNHHHSTLNPKAMYQSETPLDVFCECRWVSCGGIGIGKESQGTRDGSGCSSQSFCFSF